MKMLEKFCLWYLKKYWNSQGYKKAVALEQQKQAENLPQFQPYPKVRSILKTFFRKRRRIFLIRRHYYSISKVSLRCR